MTQPLAGKQILIVEDEPVFRSLLHGWLTSLGATTFRAEDGKDALHKMTEVHPDLMICDISMPRMNGLELVETLRNRGEQLPILMISATENMADIAKALRLGVRDVLLKPVKISIACARPFTPVSIPRCSVRAWKRKSVYLRTGMRWSVIPSPLQDYCRNYSRRCNRKCRTAVFIIDNWCRQTSPVWYSISHRFRKMIWLSIVWMSHAQAIMACWQHYCCARCFNGLLQEQLAHRGQRLPEMGSLLKQVNQLLRQANLPGQFLC